MADEAPLLIVCYEYWEREIKHYDDDGKLIAIYESNKSVRPVLMDKDTKKVLATGAWYDITSGIGHEREREAEAEGEELLEEYQRKYH